MIHAVVHINMNLIVGGINIIKEIGKKHIYFIAKNANAKIMIIKESNFIILDAKYFKITKKLGKLKKPKYKKQRKKRHKI